MSDNSRRLAYKNAAKASVEESRIRRHEVTIELRKAKKEEQFLKRRNIDLDEDFTSPVKDTSLNKEEQIMSFQEICLKMQSSNSVDRLDATRFARKILSTESNPPIDDLIEAGIVPICVELLKIDDPSLQVEAAWALTNIASGNSEQTGTVIKANGIPHLVELIKGDHLAVVEQCVWAIGNIAGDGAEARDKVLECNIIQLLSSLIHENVQVSLLRNIVWLISNLCRNKAPSPPIERLAELTPILLNILRNVTDKLVLTDVAWSISYITDGDSDRINTVVQSGIVPHLVQLLYSADATIIVPALRSVGNIVTGDDSQTDFVLSNNALEPIAKLLTHSKTHIVKEAGWTVSNIVAGNPRQIQCVLDSGILHIICDILDKGESRCQREAVWIITNMTTTGEPKQLNDLFYKYNVIKPFCKLLTSVDSRTVKIVLQGLMGLFNISDKLGKLEEMCVHIEEIGALDALEALQNHEHQEIYAKALELIETYYNNQDNQKENKLNPVANGNSLAFSGKENPEEQFHF